MKTVLVTGGAGFLARYVEAEYLRNGWEVLALDVIAPEQFALRPGLRYQPMGLPSEQFAELLRAEKPVACVHCAGSASVPLSLEEPAGDFRANTVLTFEVLEALRRNAPGCHFLYLSSAAVYGDPLNLPVRESDLIAPLSPYGFHKRQGELLCEEFSRIFGLRTSSVRIFSAYGSGLRRQVVWDICRKVLGSESVILHGTGKESRDFIHASDIARAIVLLTERAPGTGEVFNLAAGQETTIAELAGHLFAGLGREGEPVFNGVNPSGNPLRWQADVSRLAALGYAPEVSLQAGLKEVAAWCRKEITQR